MRLSVSLLLRHFLLFDPSLNTSSEKLPFSPSFLIHGSVGTEPSLSLAVLHVRTSCNRLLQSTRTYIHFCIRPQPLLSGWVGALLQTTAHLISSTYTYPRSPVKPSFSLLFLPPHLSLGIAALPHCLFLTSPNITAFPFERDLPPPLTALPYHILFYCQILYFKIRQHLFNCKRYYKTSATKRQCLVIIILFCFLSKQMDVLMLLLKK